MVTWLQNPSGLHNKGMCLLRVPVALPLTFLTLGPRQRGGPLLVGDPARVFSEADPAPTGPKP